MVSTIWIGSVLAACGMESGDRPEDLAPRIANTGWTNALKSSTEFIAQQDNAVACPPAPAGFSQRASVFQGAVGPLKKFCFYKSNGAKDENDLIAAGFAQANPATLATLAQDNSGPDVLTAAVADDLAAITQWRYHHVNGAQLSGNAQSPPASVHLMVVDTEPLGGDANSSHGATMMQFAQEAACPDGPVGCTVSVEPVLALMRFGDDSKDETNGGFMGRIYELAVGVHEAAKKCRTYAAADGSRCVINLSTGIDTELFDDAPASANALLTALQYASCTGAVIVTSAGNDVGYGTTGPLSPALHEQTLAPTNAQCDTNFQFHPPVNTPNAQKYRPLVHAVGGLGTWTGTSSITREGSMPRLAAPASHVVATASLGSDPHVLVGTSASAAITAGTAALLLSRNSKLSAAEVMQVIYDSGGATGHTAASYLSQQQPPGAPEVHRVLACEALVEACALNNARCPTSIDCTYGANAPVSAHSVMQQIAAVPSSAQHTYAPEFQAEPVQCPALDGILLVDTYARVGEVLEDVCNDTAPIFGAIYTMPQPPPNSCSVCGFETSGAGSAGSTAQVWASIARDFWNMEVQSATLTLYGGPEEKQDYALGPIRIVPDDKTTATLADEDAKLPEVITAATLTIRYATGHITTDELLME